MIVFIPAAGLGTRLRPLTDHCPKALVPYKGKPLLDYLLERLSSQGFRHFVLNLHHFPDMLRAYACRYAEEHSLRIEFSDESGRLLDTGGALVHALPLLENSDSVLVHNVDVLSDLDLESFCREYRLRQAQALLSVRKRNSSRMLYADASGRLQAWSNLSSGEYKGIPLQEGFHAYAFSGIHLISRSLLEKWAKRYGDGNPFSVIDGYLDCMDSDRIFLKEQPDGFWKDMGKIGDFNQDIPQVSGWTDSAHHLQ